MKLFTLLLVGLFGFVALPGVISADSGPYDSTAPAGVTEMKPAAQDTHHLEVKPASLEGYRIPDMKITVTAIPEGGGVTIIKELDQMFGGNLHYGVNIALEPKKYLLKFHLEPPTIMREGVRFNQWLLPIDAEFAFDAAASIEASGKIGIKETSDMKIDFETEEAESMFVLSEKNDMPMPTATEFVHSEETTSGMIKVSTLVTMLGILCMFVGVVIIGWLLFRKRLS